MMWMDYNIIQAGENFRVEGDWPGEVMGFSKDGKSKDRKENPLYRPGDVFIVNEGGWLCKVEDVSAMIMKYEASKSTSKSQ
jgi:hypothetical protein